MNKKVLFAATVAAMLASCSNDSLSVQSAKQQDAEGIENAISFEAYSQRGLTRAGEPGVMDNDKLGEQGFGVFGYYTDLNEYDQTSLPNFMYNQKVSKSGSSWTYDPIKYWPNEYGNTAVSDDVDKLTFFAYAPYTENAPTTGKVTDDKVGITGFTRKTATGDPYVKYVGSLNPTQSVDLCWGVCAEADKTWNIIQGGSQTMTAGLPWLNVQRPQKSLGQKMKFTFKHALAQLNVQIDADVNTNQHGQGSEVNFNSKVFVRSITFNGFAMKGALNLNNEEAGVPNWKGYGCSNEPLQSDEYTIYDGMKDGKEGTGYVASNEKLTGLNEKLIQNAKWGSDEEGVTKTAKNLFNSETLDAPIYVIPTGDNMNVTIVYDIETKDENLASTISDNETPGLSIENRISKTITLTSGDAMKLEAGKKYTIQLHLGMSQVEFDATVDEWDEAASAEGKAWLPKNAPGASGLTISGADVIAASGFEGQLTAEVAPAGADQSVRWSSDKPELLAVDENTGEVTLAGGIPLAGEDVTITATSTDDGSISAQVTIPVAPVVGMIIGEDGKAYANTDKASDLGSTDGVALICYLGDPGSVDVSSTSYRGLALALTDANGGNTCQWFNNRNIDTPIANIASFNPYPAASNQSGIANTRTLIETGNINYAAAVAAKNYNVDVSGFTNSGWFLPTISQWNMMIKTLAPTSEPDAVLAGQAEYPANVHNNSDIPMWTWYNAGYTAAALNPVITASGATGLKTGSYWASMESDSRGAWWVDFYAGNINANVKTDWRYVRSALAF